MRKPVVIAFLFIVIVPLLTVSWLGWHAVQSEQERFRARLVELQRERLQEFARNQASWIASIENSLVQFLESLRGEPFRNWPEFPDRNRFVEQVFSVNPAGELQWPDASVRPLTRDERRFAEWFASGLMDFTATSDEAHPDGEYANWSTWFEGPGQQWAFWIRNRDGSVTGATINRSTFMAEAIARLPDGLDSQSYRKPSDAYQLLDEEGRVLYSWGVQPDDLPETAVLETALPSPLNLWHIRLITPLDPALPWYRQPLALTMAGSILALAVITLGAAGYLFLETRREFREARLRVSFVNQVSHEFKTPLTNIQLYSELLEDSIGEGEGIRHLRIIREEAAKLGRMIQNVLTFARRERAALQVHPRAVDPDLRIREQIEIHRPGLERQGIRLHLDLRASGEMRLDPEILGQILGNLLSNAEKYAPRCDLTIRSHRQGEWLAVAVQDTGPGIDPSRRELIFEPFVRLRDRTNEGVSGTGIGLSIARHLARLHGGDLVLETADAGASFECRLRELS